MLFVWAIMQILLAWAVVHVPLVSAIGRIPYVLAVVRSLAPYALVGILFVWDSEDPFAMAIIRVPYV